MTAVMTATVKKTTVETTAGMTTEVSVRKTKLRLGGERSGGNASLQFQITFLQYAHMVCLVTGNNVAQIQN